MNNIYPKLRIYFSLQLLIFWIINCSYIYYVGIKTNQIEIINFLVLLSASIFFLINKKLFDVISLALFSIFSFKLIYLVIKFLFECTSYKDMLINNFYNCFTYIFTSGLGTILLLVSLSTPLYLACEIYKKNSILKQAKNGSRGGFLKFMAKVPDTEPDEHDRLN